MAFVRAASGETQPVVHEISAPVPLPISHLDIPEFQIPQFETTSIEIEPLHIPAPGSEEAL